MEQFKAKLLQCVKLCEQEISLRKSGIDGEATTSQLETIVLPELKNILLKIETNSIPLQKDRYLCSFAYAFKVWGWDMQNPSRLFIVLTELNNEYKEL
ncbi:MAG: hypothetical protein LBQ21_06405 [Clostridiales Family XIII bacterium]|jgi:hypothetical protein|nr:hypothetical protein [Clostridiales Family XIII bacterium]